MIKSLRRRARFISLIVLGSLLLQMTAPYAAYALTGGPSQPEVQSFQPAGTSDMVDLFTGDFSYNIPLFELPGPNGGYPFNLSYQSGIGMDQEASWVGLGWSLQPGAVTRQMRGLPDEFNGDGVTTRISVDPNVTVGLGLGVSIELFGGDAALGLGLGFRQNSYRGLGYSIDATLGFEETGKGMTGGLSLGLSVDSQDGVGINPSLSLGSKIGEFGLGCGYNSKQGFSTISYQFSKGVKNGEGVAIKRPEGKQKKTWGENVSSVLSSSLSVAHPGYTPQVTMPMKNVNFSATFKVGGSWWGIFGSAYVSGFYTEQWLANNNKDVTTNAYGYMNYQNAGSGDIMDFNREKDGLVSKESSNLALPSLTSDIYSVTGQGIGMMYRPMRNDYGAVYDKETSSISTAVGVGVDLGPAATHIGVNLNVNYSKSTSGKWTDDNYLLGATEFQKKNKWDAYEPWYFKVHGQPSVEATSALTNIGGDRAVRVQLIDSNDKAKASSTLEYKNQGVLNTLNTPANALDNRGRKSRTNAISSITNAEVLKSDGNEVASFLKVNFINEAGTLTKYTRNAAFKDHFAAHIATTADGLRYVYALPAYNSVQKEVEFSTSRPAGQPQTNVVNTTGDPKHDFGSTDEFLKITKLPPYAHSHLLTCILGPDYVDVNDNGVDENDLGYWVKFTYKRTSPIYKWRDPYSNAHFQEGWKSDPRDDRGSYVYGEKEMWYLAMAETKSHVATFQIAERRDGKGVNSELQDAAQTDPNSPSYFLNNISLYTRSGYTSNPQVPIKVTRFDYNYALCGEAPNNDKVTALDPVTNANDNANHGKLTLKKVWFEYGNSKKGSLNPYTFKYNNESTSPILYDVHSYDRWGNYKPFDTSTGRELMYQYCPYLIQDPSQKATLDANAAAWSLNEITLPSGSKITVDYESDDYGYVQNKTAMQMTPLIHPTDPLTSLSSTMTISDHSMLKVRFKLEKTVPSTANQTTEVQKYIDTQTWQLYFKLLMKLRSSGESFDEYITGYADIDANAPMGLLSDGTTTDYTHGYFTLKAEKGYHPFALRAWQHLRTNQPELANTGRKMSRATSDSGKADQIKGMGGLGAQIMQMFKGFNAYCDGKNWGEYITLTNSTLPVSWVRLNSPDKIKYGGGIRVKQITMKDQWTQDEEGIYGQTYDYTTVENGQTISSGVAAYEPIVGGDENALHYGKKYTQSIPMRSSNNLFFEYPVNESYYPGAQVGYSKVTVMSLASASKTSRPILNTTLSDSKPLFPSAAQYGTSGKIIHEFYTAKDFPVTTDETEKSNKQYKLSVPIPFLGSLSITKLTTSQGYCIVTNDMHGKQKMVSNYRQATDGTFESDPISWVKYNYLTDQKVVGKNKVSVLNNLMYDNGDGTLGLAVTQNPVYFNQETEFFHDMRQFEDNAWGGGARYNTDIVYIPIIFGAIPLPVPTVWPSISKSTTRLRSAVTNKSIFRGGILQSMEAYDGGSLVKTTNVKWDKLTGNVVLTTVTNDFDKPVYSYTKPAYLEYQGMGAAYQNLGLTFEINAIKQDPYKPQLYRFTTALPDGTLQPGDEIILYPYDTYASAIGKVIYTGKFDGDDIFTTESTLSATDYNALIFRSGYRNILSAAAGTITALQDPSVPGTPITKTKSITVPR
jgi:hypothetical protein